MDSIRSIQPSGKWKIIVVDSKSEKILNAACKMYDILEENVTLVENIEKQRQNYPSLEAIYFLTPCRESVYRLVDDFSIQPTTYKAAHVLFTSGLSDDLFSEMNRKLKTTGASHYISGLKELYVDFMVSESSVFTVGSDTTFLSVFGGQHHSEMAQRQIARQLLSVCATLGEDPVIRFQTQTEGVATAPSKSLAFLVQQEIDNFCRLNPKFPPQHQPPQPRATLLILDRSLDPTAPLLHEFTYQAMLNDLLPIKSTENSVGVRYEYDFNQADGSISTQDVVLDEEDNVYQSIRHMHIAQCTDYLVEKFNQFLAENKAAVGDRGTEPKSTAKNLKEMKDMLSNLPQFQDMKAKYSAHLNIAQECMNSFEKNKLNSVGNLEQNMATAETATGETPLSNVVDMVPLLVDPNVSSIDRVRLLMLYLIWKETGVSESDQRKLIKHAGVSDELSQAIYNLSLLGIQLIPKREEAKGPAFKKRRDRNKNREEEQPYELSRYVPVLKKVAESYLNNQLDETKFEYTKELEKTPSENAVSASGVSLRTTKTNWAKKSNSMNGSRTGKAARLIVFVIGGATYSEIRSVYELAEDYRRDIFIGTTQILKPSDFVEQMSQLNLPLPLPTSVIPPYSPPEKKIEPPVERVPERVPERIPERPVDISLSQMHLSSPQLSTKSSLLSISSNEKPEEKKKRKGFRRLFS
ncbi:Sec1-like protein [Sporodiniella umbellata]|nr:Sec1-like protein [Sporodiniella umbellata]